MYSEDLEKMQAANKKSVRALTAIAIRTKDTDILRALNIRRQWLYHELQRSLGDGLYCAKGKTWQETLAEDSLVKLRMSIRRVCKHG